MRKKRSNDEIDYFKLDADVEAALKFLDEHPDCTLEEYEIWLSERERYFANHTK